MANKTTYEELSKFEISNSRDIVISKCSRGGYTIAQKVLIDNDGKPNKIFLKGAIKMEDKNDLLMMRELVDNAINKIDEEEESENIEWDE